MGGLYLRDLDRFWGGGGGGVVVTMNEGTREQNVQSWAH